MGNCRFRIVTFKRGKSITQLCFLLYPQHINQNHQTKLVLNIA
nr:MAG TPA: hypothetical protein [Caudoviricetes sp.]